MTTSLVRGGTFLLVVFDVFRVDVDVDHLARVDLQQQLFLLLLHAVDVFDLARLASLLLLTLHELLTHLRLPSRDTVTSHTSPQLRPSTSASLISDINNRAVPKGV